MDLDKGRQWAESIYQVPLHHVMRYLLAYNFASGRILDAACGCGYGSKILEAKGLVVGVDAAEDAVEWAKRCFPGPRYICGRIEESPWEGEFETVVSLETIEHIKEPEKALQAFRRACIGKFIASVPNEERYPFKAETFAGDWSPHFRHYTPGEFDALLVENGFKVLSRFSQKHKLDPDVKEGTGGMFLVYVCE